MRLDATIDGELLITDQNEKLRLALFRTTKSDPQLGLYGADEKLRAYFATDDDSPYLVIRDARGTTRVYAGDTENGDDVIRDASEVTPLAVFRGSLGLPEIGFYGSDGKVRAYLSTDDDVPYLVIKDRSAATRVVMGGYASGKMGMDLRNAGGTAIWSRP